ncbi:MAG: hypothetical protein ABFS46_12420 [Myxococcota bacterium]
MKVFAEIKNKARKEAAGAGVPVANGSSSEDRLAQGFELLFGAHIQEQRAQLEQAHTGMTGRLAALEAHAEAQVASIEELTDKARASLERDQSEYLRRKGVEQELRQSITELRAFLTTAIAELHEKTARTESNILEQLESARNTQSATSTEHDEALFRHLEETLADLKATKMDRGELATVLLTLAKHFEDGSESQS